MISFPWDSIVERMEDGYPIYDRAYSAQQWWDIYKTFFSNGVFATPTRQFEVSVDTGMLLQVMPGYCNINGCFGTEKSTRNVAINLGRNLPRIDTVVLRFDANVEARSIELFVIEGEESENPKRPALTRTETVYELGLADVYVGANATSLSDTNITDTRAETARCGYVNPLFNVDTTGWFNQVQITLQQMSDELKKQTDTAVKLAKDILEGTVESAFQNQLDDLRNTQEKFNDLTTGLNLILGSRDFHIGKTTNPEHNIRTYDGFTNPGQFDFYTDSDGFTVAHKEQTGLASDSVKYLYSNMVYGIKANEPITISVEFMIDDVSKWDAKTLLQIGQTGIAGLNAATSLGTRDFGVPTPESGVWYKGVYHLNVGALTDNNARLGISLLIGRNGSINFRKLMVQRGSINNPIWAPAPSELVLEPNNDETTGINLLRGTRDFIIGSTRFASGNSNFNVDGFSNNNSFTFSKDSEGYTVASKIGTTTGTAYQMMNGFVCESVSPGDAFTFSFEFMVDDLTNFNDVDIASMRLVDSGAVTYDQVVYRTSTLGINSIEANKWYKVVGHYYPTVSKKNVFVCLTMRTVGKTHINFRKALLNREVIVNPIWSPNPFDNMNSSAELFSGTLPLTKGGTGLTSSPSMLVNLESTSAQNVLQSQPRPGVNGVLQPANGGTGQSSLQATRNAMGLGNTLGALPVDKGGTGATDAATARKNLGVEQISALSAWPVGSIYLSSDPTSPGELFGGTWTQLPTGKVLQTGASFQAGGSTSTSANHSHSLGSAYGKYEMNVNNPKRMYYTWKNTPSYSANYYMNITDTIYSGGMSLSTGMELGGSTSNAETTAGYPYQNVYAWRRTK